MTDLAPIGIAYDSGPLKNLVEDLNSADAAQKKASASAEEMARSQQMASQMADQLSASIKSRNAAWTDEDVFSKMKGPAASVLKQMVDDADKAKQAHAGLNEEVSKSGGIFSSLMGMLGSYGQSHQQAAHAVTEHAHSHNILKEATHEVTHALHALHPVLATVGTGMGELSGFAFAARAGFGLLAASVTGTFVAEIAKAAVEMENLKREFSDVFGAAGPEMLEKTKAAAEDLAVSVEKISPSIEGSYRQLQRSRYDSQAEGKKALADEGHFFFAPGEAGEKAMQDVLALNASRIFGPDSKTKTGEDLQNLAKIFKQTGDDASQAETKANSFFASLPKNAEQARAAALQTNMELVKLFEMSGKGADDSAKATTKFMEEIKKGLTADSFEKLAAESSKAAQTLAEAFGFKGPEAIDKFAGALDQVKSISFNDVIAALMKMHEQVDQLEVPDSVMHSWDKIKDSWHRMFEEMAKGATGEADGPKAVAKALGEIAEVLDKITPSMKTFAANAVGQFKQEADDLKAILDQLKASWQWIEDHAPSFVSDAMKGMEAGPSDAIKGGAGGMPMEDRAQPDMLGELARPVADVIRNTISGMTGYDPQTGNDTSGPNGFPSFPSDKNFWDSFWTAAWDGAQMAYGGTAPPFAAQQNTTAPGQDQGGAATQASQPPITDNTPGQASSSGVSIDFGQTSQDASAAAQSVGNLNTSVDAASQSASNASGNIDSLTSSINSMSSAASTSSSSGSGGGGDSGGPQLDNSDTADVGSNATGGVYMIGGGGTNPTPKATGGTDSINLKGTVSPGEIVAVVPADQANQDTLNSLQQMVNTSPVSIGGGGVSGTSELNASALAAAVAGSPGALPAGLDPSIRGMLQQLYFMTLHGYSPYGTSSLNNLLRGQSQSGGVGVNQQGDPFAEEKKDQQAADARRKEQDQEQQKADQAAAAANRGPSGGGGGGGGAAQVSRVAASSAVNPATDMRGLAVSGQLPVAAPDASSYSGYAPQEYTDAGPYYGGSQDQYDPYYSSYDAGVSSSSSYYDPYSALPDESSGIGADSGTDFSPTGDYGLYPGDSGGGDSGAYASSDYGFDNSSYVDTSNFDYVDNSGSSMVTDSSSDSSSSTDFSTSDYGDVVDIGSNADGGVYTIGGPGDETSGNSGTVDALKLVGKVSPGEIVAVIPKEQATAHATQTLSTLVSGSGGGPQGLSLDAGEVSALMQQIMQLYNLSKGGQPSPQSLGGVQGAGERKNNEDNKNKNDQSPAQQQKSTPLSSGARPTSRAAGGGGAQVIRAPQSNPTPNQGTSGATGSDAYTPQEYTGAGPYYGGDQDQYDPFYSSFNADVSDPNQFYDPYSALPDQGSGIGVDTGTDFSFTGDYFDFQGTSGGFDDSSATSDRGGQDYSFDNSSYVDSSNFDYFGSGDSGSSASSADSGSSDFSASSMSSDFVDYGYGSGDSGSSYDSSSSYDSGSSGGSYDYSGSITDSSGDYSGDVSFDAGDFASGGSFRVPMNPGGGTDGVSAKMNLTGGELVSIFPEDSSINSMRATTPTAYSPSPTNLSSANSDNGGGGSKNVSVNVYGVNNPMQFTQSRMAISRAARYV